MTEDRDRERARGIAGPCEFNGSCAKMEREASKCRACQLVPDVADALRAARAEGEAETERLREIERAAREYLATDPEGADSCTRIEYAPIASARLALDAALALLRGGAGNETT